MSLGVAWVAFTFAAWFLMSATTRLLTLALLAGGAGIALAYELGRKHDRRWRLAAALVAAWAVGTATLIAVNRFAPRPQAMEGPLVAGSAPTPRTACDGDAAMKAPDRLLMVFGRDAAIGEGAGPFMPARVGTCPVLRITGTAAGVTINAFGFDSDGNVVYRIRDNRFEQVIGGFLKGARPDKSTLAIVDDRGAEIAAIRYLNRNAVRISGTFRCGDTSPVRIARDSIRVGGHLAGPHPCARIGARTPYGLAYADGTAR
jgi:hypothetical protein